MYRVSSFASIVCVFGTNKLIDKKSLAVRLTLLKVIQHYVYERCPIGTI